MGINPAMGMGYGFGGDDFYTQMLYQQMMSGQSANAQAASKDKTADNKTQKQGIGLFGGTLAAAGAGTAGFFAPRYISSPVEEVKGKVKFTDDFMRNFSGEYAAMKNESKIKGFNTKYHVTAENAEAVMDELRNFVDEAETPKVAELSDDAKAVLKKQLGIADTADLTDAHVTQIREQFAKMSREASGIQFENNYNGQKALYESFDDIVKGMDDCKDAASKLDYLRSNPYIANLSEAEWQTLYKQPLSAADFNAKITACTNPAELAEVNAKFQKVDDVDALFNRVKADAPSTKGHLKTQLDTLENGMQSFARKWNGKLGMLGNGKFNVFSNQTRGALENALSSMRKAKGGRYAAIAAGAAAIGCLLYNA